MWEYRAQVHKVIDGDTVDFLVDCGFHIYHRVRTRLHRIDAPELRTDEGKLAKSWLRAHLPPGSEVVLKTHKGRADKYGRLLAEVFLSGTSVNEELVKNGHAKLRDY